jgi:predicted phosphodiesterase
MRIVVVRGDYDAHLVEHLFPQAVVPEQALEIASTHGANPLFVKCAEYVNEVEWTEFPNGGHPYFAPA